MSDKAGNVEQQGIDAVVEQLASALTKRASAGGTSTERTTVPTTEVTPHVVTEQLVKSVTASATDMGSVAKNVESTTNRLSGPLGFLATLNPIVAGIAKLFGGGGKQELPELPKFERPESLRIQAGFTERDDWQVSSVDRYADGTARSLSAQSHPSPVVVQVQAMDSRSFLDHRDEIAAAVRQALLESHSLGDVMSDR